MENSEFKEFRAKLGKTQAQMAQLLGVSLKAVHSYEQGWRSVFFSCQAKYPKRQIKSMLAGQKMQPGTKKPMPGLGVRGGRALLVYQWNHLQRCGSKKLERKNEDLQDL
jgi:DNA-binding XRE family transcriptional regulator